MIPAINNIFTNPSLVGLSQNTAMRVSCETGLKAIGRPSFIMLDSDIDSKTKKFAVTKELLYQLICLGVYLAVIPFVFKRGTFALAKKIFKDTKGKGFEYFNNAVEYLNYRSIAILTKAERTNIFENKIDESITSSSGQRYAKKLLKRHRKALESIENNNQLVESLKNDEHPEKFDVLYGALETGSYVGSILGLAILAPEISHHLISPIMKHLGFSKNSDDSKINSSTK